MQFCLLVDAWLNHSQQNKKLAAAFFQAPPKIKFKSCAPKSPKIQGNFADNNKQAGVSAPVQNKRVNSKHN